MHTCVCVSVCACMHAYWCGIGSVYMWYVGECRCADCEYEDRGGKVSNNNERELHVEAS